MPSYADLNGTPKVSAPISAAFYSTDCDSPATTRSPATSVRTSAGQISSTSSPQVNKSRITPRLPVSYSPKYEALANKEANVRLSAVPAKLQSLLSRFDPDGGEISRLATHTKLDFLSSTSSIELSHAASEKSSFSSFPHPFAHVLWVSVSAELLRATGFLSPPGHYDICHTL